MRLLVFLLKYLWVRKEFLEYFEKVLGKVDTWRVKDFIGKF